MSYDIYLPSYTIGADAYGEISGVCLPFGRRAAVIGGRRGMAAAMDKITAASDGIEILDRLWYGGEASFENVERLRNESAVRAADMIFAVGGGKSVDTAKALAETAGKPVFTFPTIASNCAACTSVSIMYKEDGSFLKPFFFKKPPAHAFIDSEIIAKSPARYMWAGMGDTYAKYFESSVSSRGERVPHYIALGTANARMCYEPVMEYGAKAYADQQAGVNSYELEQTVLAIIVSTAVASILLTTDKVIDYNTGLAHAIFYALTAYPHIEKRHLHGEVVAYGVLVLLLVDGDEENFERVFSFNKSVGLPTRLADIEMEPDRLKELVRAAAAMKDVEHNPYAVTEEMLEKAFLELEKRNGKGI
ncbi:MAG: iron-containing alcohol dehydrogenase family protein [Butyrivibrio sp.]|nr:iron-containing alcohol dehydrogenase family protein [Butyrivibrio sp.]